MLVANLAKLVDDVRSDENWSAFVAAYDMAALAQACHSDLKQAVLALETLEVITEDTEEHTRLRVLQQSLVYTVLVLYARATHGGSVLGGRGAVVQTKKLLPPELRSIHEEVIRVRNEAIAHVHLGEGQDDWHVQYGVLQPVGGGSWAPSVISRSHMFNAEVIANLWIVVPAAEQIILERYQDGISAVARFFNNFPFDVAPYVTSTAELLGCDEETAAALFAHQGMASSATVLH